MTSKLRDRGRNKGRQQRRSLVSDVIWVDCGVNIGITKWTWTNFDLNQFVYIVTMLVRIQRGKH